MKIKKAVFILIGVLGCWLLLETVSWAALAVLARTSASYHEWTSYLAERTYGNFDWSSDYFYDPYLGYTSQHIAEQISSPAPTGRFRIAIVGGSVADLFAMYVQAHERELAAEIEAAEPPSTRRPVRFENWAEGGYRQPQQIILSALYLSEADVIVSIEGYNEMTLQNGLCEEDWPYLSAKFDPSFPSAWKVRALSSIALFLGSHRDGSSPFLRLLYFAVGPSITDLHIAWTRELFAGYRRQCPNHGREEPRESVTARWMNHITHHQNSFNRPDGPRLFTFAQPNQFIDGSKPWSDEEKKIFAGELPWRSQHVRSFYGFALNEFRAHAAHDPHWVDLSGIFADHPETVYSDECCHLNDHGNQIMFEKIKPFLLETARRR